MGSNPRSLPQASGNLGRSERKEYRRPLDSYDGLAAAAMRNLGGGSYSTTWQMDVSIGFVIASIYLHPRLDPHERFQAIQTASLRQKPSLKEARFTRMRETIRGWLLGAAQYYFMAAYHWRRARIPQTRALKGTNYAIQNRPARPRTGFFLPTAPQTRARRDVSAGS